MKKAAGGGIVGISLLIFVAFLFPAATDSFFNLLRETFGSGNAVILEVPLGEKDEPIPLEKTSSLGGTPQASYKRVLISEVMTGTSAGAADEFVELYNPNDETVPLAGWSIKKRSGTGSESSFVSSARFKEGSIPPHRYFLIAHEAGYTNTVALPDAFWPKSYSLSPKEGTLVLYNPEGEIVDETSWDFIPKDQSIARISWEEPAFSNLPTPTPQNSSR